MGQRLLPRDPRRAFFRRGRGALGHSISQLGYSRVEPPRGVRPLEQPIVNG